MSSQAEKIEINLHCLRCRRIIRWAWLITYRSFKFTRLVYICSECGNVVKVEKETESAPQGAVNYDRLDMMAQTAKW